MKRFKFTLSVCTTILAVFLLLPISLGTVFASSGGGHGASKGHEAASEHGAGHGDKGYPGEVPFDVPVEEIQKHIAPMNELDLFPCSDCHDEEWEADSTRRDLDEPHDEIPVKFENHDSDNRWCLDCHSAKNRDMLRLINGNRVKFDEYYRVCEQCHKRVYREWKMGIQCKRTGHWNGEKQWMHCTQCHDPHNPPFKPMKPMPAPRTPLKVKIDKK
jgi:hypothetical protein